MYKLVYVCVCVCVCVWCVCVCVCVLLHALLLPCKVGPGPPEEFSNAV